MIEADNLWENLRNTLRTSLSLELNDKQLKTLYFIYTAYKLAAADGLAKEEIEKIKKQTKKLIGPKSFVPIFNVFYKYLKYLSNTDIVNLSSYLINTLSSKEIDIIVRNTTEILSGDNEISQKEEEGLTSYLPQNTVLSVMTLWNKKLKQKKL